MPIPVKVLQEKSRPLTERISEFLAKNRGNAYNATEIYGGLEGLGESAALFLLLGRRYGQDELDPYRMALDALVQDGTIEQYTHSNVAYYAAR